MKEQTTNMKWWQRPQPAWVMVLISVISMILVLGIWNWGQTIFAAETPDDLSEIAVVNAEATTLNYQGYITSANGQPLNGNQTISFALYNVSEGGTSLWSENHTNVPANNGFFNVSLGSKTSGGIPDALWQNPLYLETVLNGETLTPRELVKLHVADKALTVTDGSITNSKISLQRYIFVPSIPDNFPLTGSYQDLGEITIQFDSDATVIIVLNVVINGRGSRSLIQLYDNDQSICGLNHTSSHTGTASRTCMLNIPSGSHTFTLKGRQAGGTEAPLVRAEGDVLIIPLYQSP